MAPLNEKNTNSRRYSIEQLIGMRTSLLIINCVVENINKHPDIASIFKLPEQALRHPRSYSCLTSTLAKVKQPKQFLIERRSAESSEESDRQSLSKSSVRSSRDQTSWHLRPRPSFDTRRPFVDNQVQPHSAPTNLASQQAENFRRFYRAVVSPTHVRVTAGGRIVPNTRATAPPTFDPLPDKQLSAVSKQHDDLEQTSNHRHMEEGNLQGSGFPEGTTLPPGFPPMFQAPFLPAYNYLPQANSLGLTSIGHPAHNQFAHQLNPTVNGNGAQPVRISPPGQFDQSRPYLVYNNQVFIPAPAIHPPPPNGFATHAQMLGNHRFAPSMLGAPPGHFMAPTMHPSMPMPLPIPISMASFPPPLMPHANGQPPPMMAQLPPPPHGQFNGMLPMPPAHIEHYLQQLRNNLMALDDHIARQSLQDEPHTSNQRQALTGEIARLTALLQAAKPQHTSYTEDPRTSQVDDDNQSPLSTVIASGSSETSTNINSQKPSAYGTSENSTQNINSPVIRQSTTAPVVGSRLPATAAMAPPFQPRSYAPLTAAQMEQFALTSPGRNSPPSTPESQLDRQKRLLSRAETSWEESAVGSSLVSMPRAQTVYAPQYSSRTEPVASFRRAETYPNSSAKLNSMVSVSNVATKVSDVVSSNAQPYLRGHLSSNAPVDRSKPTVFEYSRPLTEAENIARAIYWGNYPRDHSTRNLPRFDGQDFYPASPIRGSTTDSTHVPIPETVSEYFKGVFGPTRSSSPVRAPAIVSGRPIDFPSDTGVSHSLFVDPITQSSKYQDDGRERVIGNDQSRRRTSEPLPGLDPSFLANLFNDPSAPQLKCEPPTPARRGKSDHITTVYRQINEQIADLPSDGFRREIGSELIQSVDGQEPVFETVVTDPSWSKEALALASASNDYHKLQPEIAEAVRQEVPEPNFLTLFTDPDWGNENKVVESSSIDVNEFRRGESVSPSEHVGIEEPNFSTLFTDPAWGNPDSAKEKAAEDSSDKLQDFFEGVFTEPGCPQAVYSPSPSTPVRALQNNTSTRHVTTPENQKAPNSLTIVADNEELKGAGSWKFGSQELSQGKGGSSNDSSGFKRLTILTPTTQNGSPQSKTSFASRVASASGTGEQKSQLLQTMLKFHVATHASVAAPAHVSAASAQGILPLQNRGSAAASLAPAMINVSANIPRDSGSSRITSPRTFDYPVTPENRSRTKYDPVLHRSPESLAAEDYAKYLKGRDSAYMKKQ